MRMNGWLRAIPCRHCLLAQSWAHWPNFPLSRRASSQVAASRTPLSDLLATAPLAAAATPPLVRRILLLTHLPLACTPARLLDAVHTGSLEALALDAPARTARLAFLEGRGAAAFCAALHGLRANTGADSDSSLDVFVSTTLAWLPYRPLHPVVAAAVAQDGARRCIVLSRPYMGSASVSVPSSGSVSMSSSSFPLSAATDTPTGPWTPAALTHLLAHLGLGPIERVDVTPLEDAPLAPPADAATHSEVAIVHFLSIADAIKVRESVSSRRVSTELTFVFVFQGPRAAPRTPRAAACARRVRHGPVRGVAEHLPLFVCFPRPLRLCTRTRFCVLPPFPI
ncbi:hypothetical protein B0H10DRAFT_488199 [Mycena sp. CBHHK59/15]|nr:hypothetical protein B0H10DRAFT_488199 [Mycena sp. CBHHK59/15]